MTLAHHHAAASLLGVAVGAGAVFAAPGCDPTRKESASMSSTPEPAIAALVDEPIPTPPTAEPDASLTGLQRYAAGQWIVERPGADLGNPLATATLLGVATVGASSRPSLLVIRCRADAGGAGLGAEFGVQRALGFDTDPFEGPGAVGGSRRLLSISWPAGATEAQLVAGWWSADWPDTFVFAAPTSPPGSKASATMASTLFASAGHDVVFSVPDAHGDGPPVTARFRLPVDSAALKDAIQPCLHSGKAQPVGHR